MAALTPQSASIGSQASQDAMAGINASTLRSLATKASELASILPGELSYTFSMQDAALAAFQEDMSKAAIQLEEAKRSGRNLETAIWRFETAESVYQTRLYEVRKNSLLKEISDKADSSEARKELHGLTMQQRMNENFNKLRQKREEEKRRKQAQGEYGFFFYFMLGLLMAGMLRGQHLDQDMEHTQTPSGSKSH